MIVGSRNFSQENKFKEYLDTIFSLFKFEEIITGDCPSGADKMARNYAHDNCIPLKVFSANWDEHGKKAGYIRNRQMAEYSDLALAFWDMKSSGTKHTIDFGRSGLIKVLTIIY